METIFKHKVCVTTAITTVCFTAFIFTVLKYKRRTKENIIATFRRQESEKIWRSASEAFHYINVSIVTDEEACNGAVTILRRNCVPLNAIGFDCEWVSVRRKRNPVAMLQLSTVDGLCCLFRLNQIKTVPSSLKELLEDDSIYKVGVVPLDDARYLFKDYGVKVKGCLDVRHLARACGYSAVGLASLSKAVVQVTLDKYWKVCASNWEAEQLTDRQLNYAAADAHVAIKMFAKLISEYATTAHGSYQLSQKADAESQPSENDFCRDFADKAFKVKERPTDNIVIRNVPSQKDETKENMTSMVLQLGNHVKCPINIKDIKNIYRAKNNKGDSETTNVIVEITSATLKNEVLKKCKEFNIENRDSLKARHLGITSAPNTPIHISKQLTSRASRLFYLARKLKQRNLYKHCWTENGKVYLRKKDKSRAIWVTSENQLESLSNKAREVNSKPQGAGSS